MYNGLNNIEKAYSTIDSVIEEVCLSEDITIQNICILLERENIKIDSHIITEIISILRQWNKIPINEIKVKIDRILEQSKICFDK